MVFFDQDIRLSKLGDSLEKLNKGIDFEVFRKKLEEKLSKLEKGKLKFNYKMQQNAKFANYKSMFFSFSQQNL